MALEGQVFRGRTSICNWATREASAEARKMGAVITIKAADCHDPATARVTATDIGVVDGQRARADRGGKGPVGGGLLEVAGRCQRRQWVGVVELVATNG